MYPISCITIQNLRNCKQCCGSGSGIRCFFNRNSGIRNEPRFLFLRFLVSCFLFLFLGLEVRDKHPGSATLIENLSYATYQRIDYWQLHTRVGCGDSPTEGGAGSRQVQALQLGGIHDSGRFIKYDIMFYSFFSLALRNQKLFSPAVWINCGRVVLRIRIWFLWFKCTSGILIHGFVCGAKMLFWRVCWPLIYYYVAQLFLWNGCRASNLPN